MSRAEALRPRRILEALRYAVVHNIGFKLLSLLAAFALWFFVNTEAAFQVPLELRNIPAQLMIVSPRIDFVDLRVSGPRTLLSRIDHDQLSMTLDLAGVRPGPAAFRLRTDTLNLPRGVTVVRLTPAEVTLELAQVVRKTVPIRLAFGGKPPGDLRVTDVHVAPEEVEMIGPAKQVEGTKQVETEPFDLAESQPGLVERELRLEAPREYVSFSAARVHAQVLLEEPERRRVLKSVPVVVRNSSYHTDLDPNEVQITVRGPRSTIDSLELSHGAVYIDVAGREPGSYELTPDVDLPAEVELVKQEPAKVRLKISKEKRRGNG
jgi:YbbR domain-containing protein